MSEIEKMYENCNIKPKQEGYCDWDSDCPYPDIINTGCGDDCPYWKYEDEAKYPPFTAEKQLKLIKWLAINKEDFGVHYRDYDDVYRWVCGCEFEVEVYRIFNEDETFEESLAGLINMLWQNKIFSLTAEEKQQIKEILK